MDNTTNDMTGTGRHNGGTDIEAAREASRHARSALRQEVRKLVTGVENLLRCVKDAADPEIARARAEVEHAVAATNRALAARADQVRQTLKASDRYVHQQPWRVISVAALAALAIGLLVGRRGTNRGES
jgi:ElaB/YqjD/DUF883 family membrane-anchored ribosome-binding protein